MQKGRSLRLYLSGNNLLTWTKYPGYDPEIQSLVRLVKPTCGGRYSFFSGHASNSFALALFFGGIFKSFSRYIPYVLLLIAGLIAYSRVYIGVHFPLDIITGMFFGILYGFVFAKLFIFGSNRFKF